MKPIEIRSKSRKEILEEIDGCNRELLNLRFQKEAGEMKNSAQYLRTRKYKAKLLTISKEIELGINKHLFSNIATPDKKGQD